MFSKERFLKKLDKDPVTGCWNWTGSKNPVHGYGICTINYKQYRVHRVSYEIFVGPIDNTKEICHSCNNKLCCNPEHLRNDTHSSNMIDKIHNGTQNTQVLSIDQVLEIKKELKNYKHGILTKLAKKYNVQLTTIFDIRKGRSWSHIDG